MHDDELPESGRQRGRRQRKEAGDRSARVAHTLMELRATAFSGLALHEDVRAAAERARATSSKTARRREERRLAGVLRQFDLAEVEAQLEEQAKAGRADATMFRRAETWRARLIEDGPPALDAFHAELDGLDRAQWHELVANARQEREQGYPKGAAKILFRQIMAALRARP